MSSLRAYGASLIRLEQQQQKVSVKLRKEVSAEDLARREKDKKEFKQLVRLYAYLQKYPELGNRKIHALLAIWLEESQELLRAWLSRDQISDLKETEEDAVLQLSHESGVLKNVLQSMMRDENTMRESAKTAGTVLAIDVINARTR